MTEIDFAYAPEDAVVIKELNCPAMVEAVSCGLGRGKEYRISFWSDGKRNTEWVNEQEIGPKTS